MRSTFDDALPLVLVHEGGYVNHPRDPGGATNKGITWRTYAAWRRARDLEPQSVRFITDEEVSSIYKRQYWDAVRADDLPAGLDYAVFDFAVNSGPARAAKFLQRILGVEADGHIGELTLAAANAHRDVENVINQLCDNRLAWLRRLSHFDTFGRGWTRRVTEVKAKAVAMVHSTFSAPVSAPQATTAAQGKAEGPQRATATASDVLTDPRGIAGLVGAGAPFAGVLSDSPVLQYAAAFIAVAVVGFVLYSMFKERAD